jgi:hypothetical protein
MLRVRKKSAKYLEKKMVCIWSRWSPGVTVTKPQAGRPWPGQARSLNDLAQTLEQALSLASESL